jgi:hypothetical protein
VCGALSPLPIRFHGVVGLEERHLLLLLLILITNFKFLKEKYVACLFACLCVYMCAKTHKKYLANNVRSAEHNHFEPRVKFSTTRSYMFLSLCCYLKKHPAEGSNEGDDVKTSNYTQYPFWRLLVQLP